MTAGLLIMAAMMGAMFLLGGHKSGHKHDAPPAKTAQEVQTSSMAVVSTAPPQNVSPAAALPEAGHAH